jgi:hypothetical protein
MVPRQSTTVPKISNVNALMSAGNIVISFH